MSGELLAVVGVGVALAGLIWRLHGQTDGRLDRIEARLDTLAQDVASGKERMAAIETRLERMEVRLDGIEARLDAQAQDVASGKDRLTAVETTLSLLVRGLHIEVSGRTEGGQAL